MPAALAGPLDRVRATLATLTFAQKATVIALVLGIAVGGFVFVRWVTAPTYEPLFSNLSSTDASAIVDELNAEEVYATQAAGDGLAPVGLALGLGTRTNPTILDGVQVFSSEAGPGTEAVTKHDMFVESGSDQNGYLSADSTSLKTISQIVADGRPDR